HMMISVALGLVVACSAGSGNVDSGSTYTGPSCPYSTAKSGGSCQANWFCDGGEVAAYCAGESDGGFDCACGPASARPRHFASADVCNQPADPQRLNTIAVGCGF